MPCLLLDWIPLKATVFQWKKRAIANLGRGGGCG